MCADHCAPKHEYKIDCLLVSIVALTFQTLNDIYFLKAEAIPESLKNMLLVMDTAGIFQTGDDIDSQLWRLTWDRIDTFLPHLKEELFKPSDHGILTYCCLFY